MEKIIKTLIILLFLCVANKLDSKSPPPGTGTGDVPANIMILLDNSGSMAWDLSGRQIFSNSSILASPFDVNADTSGNVYVLENTSRRIKVLDSGGNLVRTLMGYGPGGCNTLNYALRFDIFGDYIYVADSSDLRIKVITKTGQCVASFKMHETRVGWPRAIEVTSNYIFLASDQLIDVYNRSNGAYIATYTNNSYWYDIYDIEVNPSGTKILIASTSYGIVCEHSLSGYTIGSTCNQVGPQRSIRDIHEQRLCTQAGCLDRPVSVAYDNSGNIFIVSFGTWSLKKYNSSRVFQQSFGTYNNPTGWILLYGMSVGADGNIYVAETLNNKIWKFSNDLAGSTFTYNSQLGRPISRMSTAKNVIKKIVSNTELTSGANFGLMTWASGNEIKVEINSEGAKKIFTVIDSIGTGGGTYLDRAMSYAGAYFAGATSFKSPIIPGATCQLNYIIVVSDGEFNDNPYNTTLNLANRTPPIKTFVVGFALTSGTSASYNNLAIAGGTKLPLYANNEQELLASLTDAIKQVIASNLTFSTPAITSEVSKDNHIYQSTFNYEKNKQWEGSLKKYLLNSDGTIGSLIWDAGKILNNRSASSRKLWTAGVGGNIINNFTTTYRTELKNLFSSSIVTTDEQVDKLINFVRGVDTYDQDGDKNITEERHKLADIYRSNISIVGPPTESLSYQSIYDDSYYRSINNYSNFSNGGSCGGPCTSRRELVLAGSNAGILHAFDASSGDELWGFIPPSMINKLPKIISNNVNVTNAIYGVDGSPVVKDIYYGGSWKTIVLTGLGRGGNSYFALDITDPNSPKHLFTIENEFDLGQVHFWNSVGSKSTYQVSFGSVPNIEKDYSKLGEAISTPRIIRMRINNVDKWVAVFGGGFNGGVNPNLGSAAFVMDLENGGNLLKKIDITDKSNTIANSVPSDLVVITANGTSKAQYYGAMVYVPDYEGKITKINLTSSGTLYQSTQLFDAESSTTNGRYILNGAETTINSDTLWLYFGTGDSEKLQDQISGTENRLYGIKDVNFPNFASLGSPGTVANCSNVTSQAPCPIPGSNIGWYINLPNAQKLTAQPTIKNRAVYFPIYEPTTGTKICNTGKAILKATGTTCGDSLLSATLGTGVLSKVTTIGDKIVVGISGTADTSQATGFTKKDNLITGTQVSTTSDAIIEVEAWREN